MGIDVCALVQHDLDTSTPEVLARQLSARLNATIIYGYRDDVGSDPTWKFIQQGTVGNNEELMYRLEWKRSWEAMGEAATGIEYELYDCKEAGRSIDIYNYCFSAHAVFAGRWGTFCNFFMKCPSLPYREESVHDFRKEVLAEWRQLGCGDFVLYVPDSCIHSSLVFNFAYEGRWEDVMAFITDLGQKEIVVDMGKWYAAPVHYDDCPVAFIDDFSYWP